MFIFTYILLLISNNFEILSGCSSKYSIVNNNENNNKNDETNNKTKDITDKKNDKKKEIEDEKDKENVYKIPQSELNKLDKKYKNDVDFEYLSENLCSIEDFKMYIDVKNLYSDEIPDISNIKDIKTDDILRFLKINEAQDEINKSENINEKVKKLSEIIADDYENKRFTFENSNLLVPRCFIVHENNNCILEAYFSYLESNPYHCKFFWLLNNLFENNNLNKDNLPITYEICQFFKDAINNPNFSDKISCLNISEAWYKNVEKLKDKMDSNLKEEIEKYLKEHRFGSFQNNWYPYYLIESVMLELKDYYNFKYYINESKEKKSGKHYIFYFNEVDYFVNKVVYIRKINEQNYKDFLFKSMDKNTITGEIFFAAEWHFYTIRNINDVFFNYDSLIYKKPKVISYKEYMKLWLNLYYKLKNFNGNHKDYIVGRSYCFDEKYI